MVQATQRKSKKRKAGTAGVKALIATASVAATLAGWALLPANDPQNASASDNSTNSLPALSAPGNTDNGSSTTQPPASDFQQVPSPQSPDQSLPQIQLPQNSQGFPMPFTRSHSSR